MSIHISSKQLNRVVIQYLRECGFQKAAATLSEESGVFLNAASFPSQLQMDVRTGKWERVLSELQHLDLPEEELKEVFEQIYLDLLDAGGERNELMTFLDQTAPFATEGLRRHKLLQLLEDRNAMPSADFRKEKRKELAAKVGKFLTENAISPGRLVNLLEELGRAKNPGITDMHLDLMTSELVPFTKTEPLMKMTNVIEFPGSTEISAAVFSADGKHLIVGSCDGLIEFYSTRNFALDESLTHQKTGDFFFHEAAVTALARTSDLLISGDLDGVLKVWSLTQGALIKTLELSEISCLVIGPNEQHVLAACGQKMKILSLPDLAVQEEYSLGSSDQKISSCVFSAENIFAGSLDGWIHTFDRSGISGSKKFKPPVPSSANPDETRPVRQIELIPETGNLLILTRGNFIGEVTRDGKFGDLHFFGERSSNLKRFARGAMFTYVLGEVSGQAKLWVVRSDSSWTPVHEAALPGWIRPSMDFGRWMALHGQELLAAFPGEKNKIQILAYLVCVAKRLNEVFWSSSISVKRITQLHKRIQSFT